MLRWTRLISLPIHKDTALATIHEGTEYFTHKLGSGNGRFSCLQALWENCPHPFEIKAATGASTSNSFNSSSLSEVKLQVFWANTGPLEYRGESHSSCAALHPWRAFQKERHPLGQQRVELAGLYTGPGANRPFYAAWMVVLVVWGTKV